MYNYIILYMVTLCFYNTFHIGDTYFIEPFIRHFCNNNKNHTFYVWLLYGYYLYNDIRNIKPLRAYSNRYNKHLISGESPEQNTDMDINIRFLFMQNHATPYFCFKYEGEDIIAINTWINALQIGEMAPSQMNSKFYETIQLINKNIQTPYINNMVPPKYTLPQLPMVENNTIFNNWLLSNTKKLCFFYNYKPRSISYQIDYNNIIVNLSRRYTDYVFIVPRFELPFTDISNIKCCDRDFNCVETPDCKNIVMIEQITKMCNIIVTLPTGASWAFFNTTVLSQPNKKYILSGNIFADKLNDWITYSSGSEQKVITNINEHELNSIFD